MSMSSLLGDRMICLRGAKPTSVVKFAVILVIVMVNHKSVDSFIVQGPSDTTAMVNESTYFNCSSSIRPSSEQSIIWFHFPLDGGGQRNYVYDDGRIMTNYKNRINIEIDLSSGSLNLLILRLESKDAGRYECRDDILEGIGASAELTVLGSDVVCESDMDPGGVVGPTQCGRAITPDEVQLSYSVTYNGRNAPQMVWRKAGDSPNSNMTDCVIKDNRVTCSATLAANLQLNRAVYICELTTQRYNCSLKISKNIYVISGNETVEIAMDEEVKCSANSSQSCSYKWKWFSGSDSLTVSTDQTLRPTRVGSHRCEATCPIGNSYCVVDVMFAEVHSTEATSAGQMLWLLLLLLLVILLVTIIIIVLCRGPSTLQELEASITEQELSKAPLIFDQLKQIAEPNRDLGEELETNKTDKSTTPLIALKANDKEQERQSFAEPDNGPKGTTADNPIIIDNEQDRDGSASPEEGHPEIIDYGFNPTFLHAESLNSKEEKTSISGLTVLHKELFITFEKTSELKVFQAIAFSPVRSIVVMDLDNPLDIVSSPTDRYLYISSPNEIYKVDANGKIIVKWPIDDGGGTLSVTHDQTVILSDWKRSALREYSAGGKLKYEVRLPSDVHPFHAVKLNVDQFVVSLEHRMLHKVAIFDIKGTIIKSFSGMLKFPKHLAVNSDGYIFVADQKNSRVLMMNPILESSKVILSDKDKLGRPMRIYLDEENSRMFVADFKADNPRFMVYRLQKHKTGGNEEDEFLDAEDILEQNRVF